MWKLPKVVKSELKLTTFGLCPQDVAGMQGVTLGQVWTFLHHKILASEVLEFSFEHYSLGGPTPQMMNRNELG